MNVEITTASKSLEKQSDAPAIVEVLTRDELHRFGGTTLKDVLTRVPGLAAVSGYFTDRSMIGFPGDALQAPTSRHVLLLINGRPVREVQEGGIKTPMLEAFPIDAIERIEVVKGPGSVLYGSEAFAGVINIITTTPERNGLAVGGLGGERGIRHDGDRDDQGRRLQHADRRQLPEAGRMADAVYVSKRRGRLLRQPCHSQPRRSDVHRRPLQEPDG